MFKIVSTEIKKIVSKPGIYVLSVLLALILVFGVFAYKPSSYPSSQFELSGETFLEKHVDFFRSSNAGKKAESDAALNNALIAISDYRVTIQKLSQEQYMNNLIENINTAYIAYMSCVSDNSHQNYVDQKRIDLVISLEAYNGAVETALINSQHGSFTLLTSTSNYNAYKKSYKEVLDWAEISVSKANLKDHILLFENKYKNTFYQTINNFKFSHVTDEFIATYSTETLGTKLNILNIRLNSILTEIEANYQLASANINNENEDLAKTMDKLANLYVNTVNTYVNLVKYELICNAFSSLSTREHLNTMYLSSYSHFNSKCLLERYDFLFTNNKTENDYSKPLTIGVTSNDEANAYDYSYFVLKIFSFVIIIYAIMSACHSISGEIKEGSMRYLAIRPISRTQLLFGKWLSILLMSTILIIFSAVISLCVGGAVYGFAGKTILTIFNGSFAVTLHPIAMIAIYLFSMLLELVVYSSIAMLVSTLFKSDLFGMTLMMMLYLLNILLPMFVQGSNTWLAFSPFSHVSIYALFGSSVYAMQGNFFNLIFGAKVYAGTHAALTISIIVLITIVVSIIAAKVLKKKEL